MRRTTAIVAIASLCAGAPLLCAQPYYTETFEGGVNAGGWTFGAPTEAIQPTGGFPGAYLRGSMLDTTIPFLRTGVGVNSPFVGNYRARRIIQIFTALTVFATDFPIGDRPPALILYNDNGTPADPLDDWGAYQVHLLPLRVAGQWEGFGWSVPYGQTTLPTGWHMIDFGPNAPPGRNWDTLIQDVDRLMFSFGDPSLAYIFQMWAVGADQIGIFSPFPCYPNCDNSTAPPCLNVNDFVCFTNQFAAASSYANCDHSSNPPMLNVNDYVCFLMSYAAGCSSPCEPHP